METASIELWHGSSHVIKHPECGLVKPNNDYGRGFYCTRSVELARNGRARDWMTVSRIGTR